jgi:hypothetical protein
VSGESFGPITSDPARYQRAHSNNVGFSWVEWILELPAVSAKAISRTKSMPHTSLVYEPNDAFLTGQALT